MIAQIYARRALGVLVLAIRPEALLGVAPPKAETREL
jgi:hypothetical protein